MNNIVVGLGEVKISNNPNDILVAYGLGSCLGIAMYDPVTHVAGMVHAVLPSCDDTTEINEACSKYVCCGLEVLLQKMLRAGALRTRIVIRMAGGANMLASTTFSDVMNIGFRNIESSRRKLSEMKFKIAGEEVGGNIGRTVRFYVADGRMAIRMMGGKERDV
ncbi:MAG: chemotaxis protein CheD [Chloroflexota bacterium]|jgi:chemotaxis protein CheD